MTRTCAAVGCTNHSMKRICKEKYISFHGFPLGKPECKQWVIRLRRKDFVPSQYSSLCSEHFTEDCFIYQPFTNRRGIKPGAIPTLFSYAKPSERKRISYEFGLVNQAEKVTNSTLVENQTDNVEETSCDSMSDSSTLTASISNEEEEKSDEPELEIIHDISSTKSIFPSKRKSRNLNGIRNFSDVEKNSDIEDIEKTIKKRKADCPSPPETMMDVPEVLSVQNNFDREDIFGHYVVSELRPLKDNRLLYLQTKQSILEILTSAHLEYLNPPE